MLVLYIIKLLYILRANILLFSLLYAYNKIGFINIMDKKFVFLNECII